MMIINYYWHNSNHRTRFKKKLFNIQYLLLLVKINKVMFMINNMLLLFKTLLLLRNNVVIIFSRTSRRPQNVDVDHIIAPRPRDIQEPVDKG